MLDQHPPIKRMCVRGDQRPWITPQILQEISLRNRMCNRHKKNPTLLTWEAYKKQGNKVTSFKRNGIKMFCYDTSNTARHPREFWEKMQPLLPSSGHNKKYNIILVENDLLNLVL